MRAALATIAIAALAAVALAAERDRIVRRATAASWVRTRAELVPRTRARDDVHGYLGSDGCRPCHGQAHASWAASFHRTMTQPAERATILAPWEGTRLPDGSTLGFVGARPISTAADGAVATVAMITGSHHMQIYWRAAGGRLEALPYAWLVDERRFVPNEATLLRPGGDAPTYTWNRICIRCHAVAGSPGWREGTAEIDTRTVELGIACESCHGPGRAHAEAERTPLGRYLAHLGAGARDIVDPRELSADASSQVCAQCHAITVFADEDRWLARGPSHASPDPIDRWGALVRHPSRVDQPWLDAILEDDADYLVDRFWSDGEVRVTGREYNGMVESACHGGGELGCTSCHDVHGAAPDDQLAAHARGDGACTPCHDAGRYAATAHTHHDAEGEGARCMNCHMPHTSWGLLGGVRSHRIKTVDLDADAAAGRPNPCNLCHLDRSASWAASTLARWRGDTSIAIVPDEIAASVRWLLAGDAGLRALAAWHMAWPPARAISGTRWQAELLLALYDDPYPAVRLVAHRARRELLGSAGAGDLDDGELPDAALATALVSSTHTVPDRTGPAVLRDPAGALDRDRLAALQATHDDARVALAE